MKKNKIITLLVLPLLVYFIYRVFVIYTTFGLVKACDVVVDLQTVGLVLFLEFLLLYIFSIRERLVEEFNNFKDLIITFSIVFVIKIIKFNMTDIDIDSVYLLQIFISSTFEFIILIPAILIYKKYNFAKYFYKIILLLILALNISSYFYFYTTLETLNPIIFDNVNLISIKAMLDNFSIIDYLYLVLGFALFLYIFKLKNMEKSVFPIVNYIKIILVILLTYNVLSYMQKGVFTIVCLQYGNERGNRNLVIDTAMKNTSLDLVQSYIDYIQDSGKGKLIKNSYEEYTSEEKLFLTNMGLINNKSERSLNILNYDKVIFITFESLSRDFINFYNDEKIPKEATSYLNYLLKTYPHLDNFYSAGWPTQEGLNAITRSKFTYNNFYKNEKTLFSFFNENKYYTSYIRGISKYYGVDQMHAKKYFRATNIVAREELEDKYGCNISSNWGAHNDAVFDKAIDSMKTNEKLFLFIKTIDFHHPGSYYADLKYPKALKDDYLLKSLYWLDKTLEDFFLKMEENNLFDDKTIVFISADHHSYTKYYKDKYVNDYNEKGTKRIPFIIATKKPLKNLNNLQDKYSSQVDLLPTFFTNSDDYIGRNLNSNNKNFFISFYKNIFTYEDKNKDLKYSLDIRKCTDFSKVEEKENTSLSFKDKAICKLLYNTNNI